MRSGGCLVVLSTEQKRLQWNIEKTAGRIQHAERLIEMTRARQRGTVPLGTWLRLNERIKLLVRIRECLESRYWQDVEVYDQSYGEYPAASPFQQIANDETNSHRKLLRNN